VTVASPLGVYVHWPYCARICPYCDFNVYKNRAIDVAAWKDALTRDLGRWAERTPGRRLTSLYFGGGTPSLAPIEVIDHVIKTCDRLWGFEAAAEITLEANPTDAEQARFQELSQIGVNRLSLGVQSLRDDALRFLGRDHHADDAKRAIATAQDEFKRVTFDLIYGRPDQLLDDWRAELEEALGFGAGHLSLYQLTIEPETAFASAVDKGRWTPPDDDACADMFDAAQEMTAAAGLPAYEISNHARAGDESRHNLTYWKYADYIGVGPGAHGRFTQNTAHGRLAENDKKIATETLLNPQDYLAAAVTAAPIGVETPLTTAQATVERLSMGLRLTSGIDFARNDPFFDGDGAEKKLRQTLDDRLLEWNGQTLKATPVGRRILNRVLYELFG
jgi:oxygen-independent coproporphyrinogen-3 oxidase